MERKTIGSFMSALRKSYGFTQQEVADKLNVSNKTVSKWERDESSPDIGLIPVIAELYGVTCDEILLGERFPADNSPPNKSVKVEKQIKHMAGSLVLKFKNRSLISILLAIVGLILVFSVSYAFYTPIIGFSLNLMCIAVSVTLIAIQFNTIGNNLSSYLLNDNALSGSLLIDNACGRNSLNDSALSSNSMNDSARGSNLLNDNAQGAENPIMRSSMAQIYRWFFAVLSVNIFVLFLSMPFIIVRDDYYLNSVISIETYLIYFPVAVAVSLIAVFSLFYSMRNKINMTRINSWIFFRITNSRKMTLIQFAFITGAALISLRMLLNIKTSAIALSPFFSIVPFYILILCSIITAILYTGKEKNKQKRFLLAVMGIRNFLVGASVFAALSGISSGSIYDGNMDITTNYYSYRFNMLSIAWLILISTVTIYLVIKYWSVKKTISNLDV